MTSRSLGGKLEWTVVLSGGIGVLTACIGFAVFGDLVLPKGVFIAAGTLAVSLAAAWLTARLLLPKALAPVSELAQAIQYLSMTKDYSVLPERADGDLDLIVAGTRELVRQLQDQEQRLEQHRKHVKDQIAFHTGDLRRTNAELLLAQREAELGSQSKSVFLANMSHELRTPLNAIIGYGEMLAEEAEDLGYKELIPDLQKIRAGGKSLLEWVDQILDLSKIESGRAELCLEPFDVAVMARAAAEPMIPVARETGVRFEVRCPPDLGSMKADRERVRSVLVNLLKNACKTSRQGTVTLAVSRETVEGVDWVQFAVSDSASGLSPEAIASAFRDHAQTEAANSSAYGGFALGLAICRRFSLLMGGNIFAEDGPGPASAPERTGQTRMAPDDGGVSLRMIPPRACAEAALSPGTSPEARWPAGAFILRLPADVEVQLSKSHVLRGTNRLIRDLLNLPEGKA
ncbi:MAG: hypothetical protein HY579_05125 [Nitrospinae bacterium]|nr:hypothetical protein [Nitrospinota bacterium]